MRLHTFYIAAFLMLSACTGAWETYPPAPQSIQAAKPSFYAGEVVTIAVFGEDSLSGDYTISNDGFIKFPLVGDIAIIGLTQVEAELKIAQLLMKGGYLLNPEITVSAANEQTFSIMGEVLNTGEYPYKNDMTVLDAVARGGGFSYRANQTKFDIVRKMPDGSEDVINAQLSTRIAPTDIIRVRERFF